MSLDLYRVEPPAAIGLPQPYNAVVLVPTRLGAVWPQLNVPTRESDYGLA